MTPLDAQHSIRLKRVKLESPNQEPCGISRREWKSEKKKWRETLSLATFSSAAVAARDATVQMVQNNDRQVQLNQVNKRREK